MDHHKHTRWQQRTQFALTLAVVGIVLVGCVRAGNLPDPSAFEPIPLFPAIGNPPLIVDAHWLAGAKESAAHLRILDASDSATYGLGHIPGAVHAWWQDTMNLDFVFYGAVLPPWDDQERRIGWLRDLGITDDTMVVVYDDVQNRHAARFVWLLRFLGHDRSAVLDGGLSAWLGTGGALSRADGSVDDATGPVSVTPTEGYYLGTDRLLPHVEVGDVLVLDVRTDDELNDTAEGTIPVGRIPGAISIPWTTFVKDEAGRLHDPESIQAILDEKGVTPDRLVVVSANTAIDAAHTWWVLKMLGYGNVLVHDWGWAGWVSYTPSPTEIALPIPTPTP